MGENFKPYRPSQELRYICMCFCHQRSPWPFYLKIYIPLKHHCLEVIVWKHRRNERGMSTLMTNVHPYPPTLVTHITHTTTCPSLEILKRKCSYKSVFLLLQWIDFPGQTVNFCLKHVTHILKAINLTVHLVYLGTLYVHPVTRQKFRLRQLLQHCDLQLAALAETLS